ncbi:MAG: ABC transporter substrate-binding protein [Rhodospirillaceae bacterium]
MTLLNKLAARLVSVAAVIGLTVGPAAAQQRVKMDVGYVPATASGPLYIAKEKGYYADLGIDVEMHRIVSSSDMAAMLATNRLQVISGALSVGFFNSVEKGLPVKIMMSRNGAPAFHNLLVRTDLKDAIKTPADLKGRTIAIVARGSIIVYEVGKVLEKGGLTLNDIEAKYMPFNQMSLAFENKAIDAAMMIPPLVDVVVQKGFAVKFIDPEDVVAEKPILLTVKQVNTDWAAKNPQAAKDFVYATLKGAHEFCNAYHHGPNRAEVVQILAKYSDVNDPAMIEKIDWGTRDPTGRIFEASLADIQDFYFKEKLTTKKFPLEQLVQNDWLADANRRLGPFKLIHDDGKPGCR